MSRMRTMKMGSRERIRERMFMGRSTWIGMALVYTTAGESGWDG
jgi:hypothetical protein